MEIHRSPASQRARDEADGAGQRKQRKQRAKKDPNAPKGPKSAFILFGNEMRPKVKAESPEMSMTEVGKKLGELWNALSSEEKERFQASHASPLSSNDPLLLLLLPIAMTMMLVAVGMVQPLLLGGVGLKSGLSSTVCSVHSAG